MTIRSTVFALLKIGIALVFLAGCFGNGPIFSFGTSSSITVSPRPASVAAGSTVTFTATTANTLPPVSWILYDPAITGTISSSTGTTITYTAPATPPVYVSPNTPPGPQGAVSLGVSEEGSGNGGTVYDTINFIITAPTVTVGLSPLTASVALGATQQFTGYAVGNVNNALTWQVDGVTGGSTAFGSITNAGSANMGGLYTAPTAMPMTGPTVTITLISQADPTKTQTAVVTLH